jgi:hypothetical protein
MLSERGRGAVLVGAARVDAALDVLLKAALAPPSGSETLFLTDRPLGSFGARIALAQRLGLIDRQVERTLHTLRRVRNAFAHSTAVASLDEASYQQPLGECYQHARENPLWRPLERILDEQLQRNPSARERGNRSFTTRLHPADHDLGGLHGGNSSPGSPDTDTSHHEHDGSGQFRAGQLDSCAGETKLGS